MTSRILSHAAVILALVPIPADAQMRLAAMVHLPERLDADRARVVDEALRRALAGLGEASSVAPDRTFALLAREARVKDARSRAAELLARALVLIDRLRYPEALQVLDAARSNAVAGLAQLVQPKLLADLDFHTGVVKHVMQSPEASALLERSFALWPRRAIDSPAKSPKVLRALRQAAVRAARVPPPLPTAGEMRRAANLVGVERFVLVTPLEQGAELEVVELRVFHRAGGRWIGSRKQVWPSGASLVEIFPRMERAVRRVLDLQRRTARSPTRGRRVLAWVTTGAAVALAGAGAALFAVSDQRMKEAESLATTPPSVEYADEAQGLESEARQLRIGAIVTLSLAAVAAAGAVVLWLTSGPKENPIERRIAPRGAGVLVRF